ncbi:hypothetical protein [Streptomyces sp. NPDC060366]|uniref:hypothetical protein n=1 Tax=Streptomyces sp. NPDC060366 TaxID=3347105 RepID=UPI003651C173
MTTVTPNPPSPYADADPTLRHMFPSPFGPPLPGHLAPTGCNRLAVVPPETSITTAVNVPRAAGFCPGCIADLFGQEPPEDIRPVANCRDCDATTDHDGLCAMCRMDAHDEWWPTRDTKEA